MLYCDYDTYTAQGGKKSATEFALWAQRASSMIDRLTFGRAKYYTKDAEIAPQLADACAQIVDLLATSAEAMMRGASGLASAATNDGYSETFLDAAQQTRRTEAEALYILRNALGSDPKGLCYLGVCC